MQNPAPLLRGFLLTLLLLLAPLARAHDLSASYATIRAKPDVIELQVKMAAEQAWNLVQSTVAPGVVFVMEEFEKVAKPALLKFAATMEELTVDRNVVAPKSIDVVVAEDNFIFTFTYPRSARATLKENYLKRMPPDYVSRVVVEDSKKEPIASKTLRPTDPTFEFSAPPAEKKTD